MPHQVINSWGNRRIAASLLSVCLLGCAVLSGCNSEPMSEREMPVPVDPARVFVEKLLPELDAELRAHADAVATGSALQNYLEIEASHTWSTRVAGGIKYADLFARVYPANGYHKAFAQSDGLTERGEVVLQTLQNAGYHDLDPDSYHIARIQSLSEELGRISAKDPAWQTLALSGEEANALVNWLHENKIDTAVGDRRTKILDALVGASVTNSVDEDDLAPEKSEDRADKGANAEDNSDSERAKSGILPTPVPRITEQLHAYLGVFEGSAKITAELELRVVDGALRYARDMKHFNLVRQDWRDFRDAGGSTALIYSRLEKTYEALRKADAEQARTIFAELEPQHPQYQGLLDARARYLSIAEQGGWERVNPVSLSLGTRSPRVEALRTRLAIEGYLPLASGQNDEEIEPVSAVEEVVGRPQSAPESTPAPAGADTVDAALVDAVKAYQEAHQFRPSAEPDAAFWRSVNVSTARRIEQIELSIQRWRESQYQGEKDFIMVNIPDFHAEVFADREPMMRFRVVTGDNKRVCDPETKKWTYPHATPIMMAELNHVIINPYWYVPQSIITHELEPKIKRDPDYLAKNGYEVVELNGREAIRQVPGPENALGFVKFIFPNAGNIYMHDTPSKRYFDYPVRAFSHGCVRVHEPKKLAEFLIGNDPLAKKYDVDELIDSERQRYVELEKKIPVFIEYKTVRVDESGRAHFLADIYRKDQLRAITDPAAREKYETCQPRRAQPSAAPPVAGDDHDTALPEGVESDVGP